MKLAVLISGSGSNLQAFIDACDEGRLAAEVAVVISNRPQAAGLHRAADVGIPCRVIDHTLYPDRAAFDQALLDAMAPFQPDLVILAGFMRILTPSFIGSYRGKLLNIHPSLLPKYPGLNTHQRALDAGDSHGGATVHFVTEELDGGPPVLFAAVPIDAQTSVAGLAQEVQQREHQIYPQVAQWFVERRLALTPSGATLDGDLLPRCGLDVDTL